MASLHLDPKLKAGPFIFETNRFISELVSRWIGATLMEATNARRVFPCLDEPANKATFEMIVGHKKTMNAISNMPLNRTQPM